VVQLVSETTPQVRRDRLLRLADVEGLTGLKKSTIYLLMKRGQFPRCVQVTARCVAWPESRVLQFVQDRIAAANVAPAQRDLVDPARTEGSR
jgi:prophage regulatory protein